MHVFLPLLLTLQTQAASPALPPSILSIVVDSGRKELTITAGPFDLAAGMPESGHAMMHDDHSLPVMPFRWPVDGWLRGLKVEVTDAEGHQLSSRLIHHFNLINYSRRQLFYPSVERTVAVGRETGDIILPKGVGVPMPSGSPLGLLFMFHNEQPEAVLGVRVKLTFLWLPTNMNPRPKDVFPVYMDTENPVGKKVSFDLPAGKTSWQADFNMPLTGRILGVGGHAHDYATGILLQDLGVHGADSAKPKTVVKLAVKLDSAGQIQGIERKLPGVSGEGIKLVKDRRYRLIGTYDNPTGETLVDGAMIHLAYIFTPNDPSEWPKLEPDDPGTEKDLAFLASRGEHSDGEGESHEHQHSQ